MNKPADASLNLITDPAQITYENGDEVSELRAGEKLNVAMTFHNKGGKDIKGKVTYVWYDTNADMKVVSTTVDSLAVEAGKAQKYQGTIMVPKKAEGKALQILVTDMNDVPIAYSTWITKEAATARLPYVDVAEDDWFYDGVYYNYFAKTMTGKDETHFAPLENLARAQFAVIIHRMQDEPKVEYEPVFPDVADQIWYTDAILWAAGTGVVTGYSDTGFFGPADNINREQMAVMMYRYAKYLKYDVSKTTDFDKFEDAGSVSEFADDAMKWAVGNGIITGKYNGTKIDPQGNALRGECALIIQRFMLLGNNG